MLVNAPTLVQHAILVLSSLNLVVRHPQSDLVKGGVCGLGFRDIEESYVSHS